MHAHGRCCKARPVSSHAQLNYPAAPALYPAESPTRGLHLCADTKPLGLTMKYLNKQEIHERADEAT